jgi:hypothetical protein
VQQQQRRRFLGAGLAVEDLDVLDVDAPVEDRL